MTNLSKLAIIIIALSQLNCASSRKLLEDRTVTLDDDVINLKAFDSNSNNKVDFYELYLGEHLKTDSDSTTIQVRYMKKALFRLIDYEEDGYFDVYVYDSEDKKYKFLRTDFQLPELLIRHD